MSLIKESENLITIPYEDIKQATKNFTTLIGRGGYGPVYRAQLSLSGELTIAAVKRLQNDNISGQGLKEFLTEIQLLSRYKHPNIVSLVGFCEERNEKFLIYEYAEHGSLDNYLKPTKTRCTLTWKQRLNICIDAARGLDHLHNPASENERVIHRDIKSANILLDHNWKARIADLGLATLGRANEHVTYVITNACGTLGYCDPAYRHTGILTKESDIYSFGVVLLEVLCGRLCLINVQCKERFLAPLAQHYYAEKKLYIIIDPDLRSYMNSDSMKEFSDIAFQCLQDDRKQRPSMGLVLQKLENALTLLESEEAPELLELEEALELQKLVETLQRQESSELQELEKALGLHELVETLQMHEAWELKKLVETLELQVGELRIDHEVIKTLYGKPDSPVSFINRDKIYSDLSSGLLVDEGTVWVSVNGDGKTSEMISAIKCMSLDGDGDGDGDGDTILSEPESRFSKVANVCLPSQRIHVKFRTQFLSSNVAYAAYLVCKPCFRGASFEVGGPCKLLYKLQHTDRGYSSHPPVIKNNGWWMFELFQSVNHKKGIGFDVTFDMLNSLFPDSHSILFEGIQFLPVVEFKDDNDIEKLEGKNLPTLNTEWESRLPSDYKKYIYYSNNEMMKKPQRHVKFPSREEAYSILSRGVLIKDIYKVNMWFWITDLNGKKCFMLPPKVLFRNGIQQREIKCTPASLNSRIENALHRLSPSYTLGMCFKVPNGLLSTNTAYGCFLVYKLRSLDVKATLVRMQVNDSSLIPTFLNVPISPVIGPDGVCISHRPISNLNIIKWPRKRKDGWFELNLWDNFGVEWMNKQDKRFDISRRENTWKSWFHRAGKRFTSKPPYSSHVVIYMEIDQDWYIPELVVVGIEFRPV